jgi:DNA-binding Lrp family transcriptional regulator
MASIASRQNWRSMTMVKAYVLIKTASGKEDDVLRDLINLNLVEEAHKVFGMYDLVAEVIGRDMETVVDVVTGKIRKVEGMIDTQTLLVVDAEIDMGATGLGI